MQQVYNVWGLGFGDDEDAWELCSTHKTPEGASEARKKILKDCDLPDDMVKVEPQEVTA